MDQPCVFFPFKISYRLDTRFVLYLNVIWLVVLAGKYNGLNRDIFIDDLYEYVSCINLQTHQSLLQSLQKNIQQFQNFTDSPDFEYSQCTRNNTNNSTKHPILWHIPTILTTVFALTYTIIRFMRLKLPSMEARLRLFPTPSDPNSCDSWYMSRRATYCAWVFALDLVFLVAYICNHTERTTFIGSGDLSVFWVPIFSLPLMFLVIAIWRFLMWVPYLEWVHQNDRMRSRARELEKGAMVSVDLNTICQCQSRSVPEKDTFERFFWVWEI